MLMVLWLIYLCRNDCLEIEDSSILLCTSFCLANVKLVTSAPNTLNTLTFFNKTQKSKNHVREYGIQIGFSEKYMPRQLHKNFYSMLKLFNLCNQLQFHSVYLITLTTECFLCWYILLFINKTRTYI